MTQTIGGGRPWEDTVYLEVEPSDHPASLRSKLEQVEGEQVVVVVPRGVTSLRDPVALRLLQRSLAARGRPASLLVEDGPTRTLARDLGLHLVNRRDGTVYAPRPGDALLRWLSPGTLALAVILGLLSLAALASFLLTSATITVQIETQSYREELEVTAFAGLEGAVPARAQVPGRLLEADLEIVERTFATGQRLEGEKTARGQVTFVALVKEALVVPQGTRLATATGLQFQTLGHALLLPESGGSAKAEVEALMPGTLSNVPPLSIDQVLDAGLRLKVRVLQETALSGGSDQKKPLVSRADRERLQQQARARLAGAAGEALSGLRKPAESLYPESVHSTVLGESFDHQVDEEAETVTITLKARARGVAFRGSEVNAMVLKRLEEKGLTVVRQELRTMPLGLTGYGEGWAAFQLQVEAQRAPKVDLEATRAALRGRSVPEAQAYLQSQLPLLRPPVIELRPAWPGRLPLLAGRTELRVVSSEPRPE